MKLETIGLAFKACLNYLTGKNIPAWLATLIVFGAFWIITYLRKYYKFRKDARDLHPFYDRTEIKNARLHFVDPVISAKFPTDSPDDAYAGEEDNQASAAIDFFIDRVFKNEDAGRFHMLLGDSGMGKTTFLINLYLRYCRTKKKYCIRLFPIAHPGTLEEIERINKAGNAKNTIILIDAFDEDAKARDDWRGRFDEILAAVQNFRYVVMSVRTQFFPVTDNEPITTSIRKHYSPEGFHQIPKWFLVPFSDQDINNYLKKKYGKFFFNRKKRQRAKAIVRKCPNLMIRPMLLSYIDELTALHLSYKHMYQVYEALVSRWIAREANRARLKEDEREIFTSNLHTFSRVIAVAIYRKWTEEKQNGLSLSADEIKRIGAEQGIELDELEMKTKSLLTNDADGRYKFAHRSIWEYFLALEHIENDAFEIKNFMGLDQAEKFILDMTKVKGVIKFFKKMSIVTKVKTFEYIVPITKHKVKQLMKTITVDENQLTELLAQFDNDFFVEAFREFNIEDFTILFDSEQYKIKNLKKLTPLLRITIFNNMGYYPNSQLRWLRSNLENVYIPGMKRDEWIENRFVNSKSDKDRSKVRSGSKIEFTKRNYPVNVS